MAIISIGRVHDVPEGTMKGFSASGKQVLVANVEGNIYAMDAICSHMGGYLLDGVLEGKIVTCPVHHAKFDVTNGKFLFSESKLLDLDTYEVIVEGEEINIRI